MARKSITDERLMTMKDVAEYLQIKERTIYGWVQNGQIPGFKLGNSWRFKREDIDLWIEERKKDTPRSQIIKDAKKGV